MSGLLQHHDSLMHGWVPVTAQVVTGLVLLAALRWRRRLVAAAAVGAALAATAAHWYVASQGLAGEPAPHALWVWIGLTGFAAAALVSGGSGMRWWRRTAAVAAVPLCALCAALALNLWTGYFPTMQTAWGQLTAGPLPDQTDMATVAAFQVRHAVPRNGSLVPVDTGDAGSGFRHRGELVYLPPAWFASDPPPRLPTVMMIGGEMNTPADWARAGNAVQTADDFAATHGGNAPVLVFADVGGTFNNDTECVNGRRGRVADHLTNDVVPDMISMFGVSPDPANWGVVGWSMGGTCAVDLTVMHPDRFSAFEDIAGDLSPNAGTTAQTIERLFGGDAAAYAAFDPTTVITRHGRYSGVSGWFAVNGVGASPPPQTAAAAQSLCALGASHGIDCAVVSRPGRHDWPFASGAFAEALPWLAGQIGTPSVPRTALPQPIRAPSTVQVGDRLPNQ
ncbi:MAG: alpha/beta hydrolase-fold protein [Mycobacterium sp.]|nr:alpha/beta hydrolase-fold protein [Mycobacterium sp.]